MHSSGSVLGLKPLQIVCSTALFFVPPRSTTPLTVTVGSCTMSRSLRASSWVSSLVFLHKVFVSVAVQDGSVMQ